MTVVTLLFLTFLWPFCLIVISLLTVLSIHRSTVQCAIGIFSLYIITRQGWMSRIRKYWFSLLRFKLNTSSCMFCCHRSTTTTTTTMVQWIRKVDRYDEWFCYTAANWWMSKVPGWQMHAKCLLTFSSLHHFCILIAILVQYYCMW